MKVFIVFAFLLTTLPLKAQDFPRQEINFQQVLDDLMGPQTEDITEDVQENLMQYLSHPLDLNKATADEIRSLHILSDAQIESLIQHRIRTGDFLSIYEIQAIADISLADVYRLVPFTVVSDPSSRINEGLISRIMEASENYFLARYSQLLQKKSGFARNTEDAFAGSPAKMYIRFRASKPGDFSFGFTLEKDEGEKIQWNPANRIYGFDYFSFHAQLVNKNNIKNIIIGDFQCQFGQGLTLGISGMGKGGETITTARRNNIGFLPYTSAYEGGGFRGVATTIKVTDRVSGSTFFATNYRDASFTEEGIFSSLQTTGLHRNNSELSKRKTIREQNAGAIAQYRHQSLDAGVIVHFMHYSESLFKNPSPYNQFTFSGNTNVNTGTYMNYTFRNFSFFAELSKSASGGWGAIGGVLGSLNPKFDLSFAVRNYQRNFYTLYGNALSENTIPQNERGIYWGWKYRFNRKFSVSGYMDLFYFPWLRFRSYRPSSGNEWLLRFDYQPSRKVLLSVQSRTETKERNTSDENIMYVVQSGRKQNFLFSSQYGIGQKLRLRTRFQYSEYAMQHRTTYGMCVTQDLLAEHRRFKLTLRYALFDTDDFDNRQYVYENDVWLAYSLPAYDGRGVRKVVMLNYKLSRAVSFWVRFSRTRYEDRNSSGSGIDAIAGNIRDEIKFQAMIRF